MEILFTIMALLMVVLLALFVRNNWVYNQQKKILNKINPGDSDFEEKIRDFDSYSDYNTMIWKFWIWDINKFKPTKVEE